MRYTYEYKRKCVELYREGKWPETPEGVSNKSFRDKVRLWCINRYESSICTEF